MLGETEKSSDVCRTASLSEMGYEQTAATRSTVTDQRRRNFFFLTTEPRLLLNYDDDDDDDDDDSSSTAKYRRQGARLAAHNHTRYTAVFSLYAFAGGFLIDPYTRRVCVCGRARTNKPVY